MRDGGSVQCRACYVALAIGPDGERAVLGMCLQASDGAKFWMQVLTDIEQRGVQDVLIACVDRLKGFPEATYEHETFDRFCGRQLRPGRERCRKGGENRNSAHARTHRTHGRRRRVASGRDREA